MDQAKITPAEPALLATWPRCVQVAVAVLLALGIGFILGRGFNHPSSPRAIDEADVELSRPRLDLNRASRTELTLLPGMGPSRALSVADYRRLHGPFRSVDDLRQVAGIGPKTLEELWPWLFVDATTAIAAPPPVLQPVAAAPAKANKKAAALMAPINVNLANAAELQKLPGVGAKTAQRILDERTLRGPFKTVDELRRVPGIGPKKLETLRPHVVVDEPLTAGTPVAQRSIE